MKLMRLGILWIVVLLATLSLAQTDGTFRLVFSNTSLSTVLRAIGLRTGANIVYVGKEDPGVTLNVTAGNADDALRFATAAASMTYRRVGETYVVAKHEDMRQALEPFGLRYRLTLEKLTTGQAMSALRVALPYLTVQAVSGQLLITGTRDDISQAQEIIKVLESTATEKAGRETTEVVPVRVVPTAQVALVLGEMFPDIRFRQVIQGEMGGSLVITGPEGRVAEARRMLALIDTRNPLPGSEEIFQVYEIRYSSAPVLVAFLQRAMPDVEAIAGPESYAPKNPRFAPISGARVTSSNTGNSGNASQSTQSGGGGSTGSPETTAGPGEKSKRLILRGARDRVEAAVRMLDEVDTKPKQVMVEVKVVDYSPSNDSTIGMDWSWTRFGFVESVPGTSVAYSGPDRIGRDFTNFTTRPAGFGTFSRVPWTFQSILQALITNREAKLLATPSVQVIDNEDANIFIGDTIRARVAQQGTLGGQTVEIVEFPIGIILLIRPRVNADGDITLKVHPVVSTVTAIDSDNIPQTSTREAETTVVVRNGETMVLGGLIRDEMSKVVRAVPLLSQLPLIGELFKSTTTSGRKSEILVFITPRIVDGPVTSVEPAKAPEKSK